MKGHVKRTLVMGAIGVSALGLVGCVSTEDFEAHLQEFNALNARVTELDGRVTTVTQAAQAAQERADAAHKLAEGKFVMTEVGREQIQFDTGSAKLSDEAKATLTTLAERLKSENKNVFLEVRGHTDSQGGKVSNRQLGRERAQNTARFLADQGVPGNKMQIGSWGEDTSAREAENNPENRRVDILIMQ